MKSRIIIKAINKAGEYVAGDINYWSSFETGYGIHTETIRSRFQSGVLCPQDIVEKPAINTRRRNKKGRTITAINKAGELVTKDVKYWSEQTGLSKNTLYGRMDAGVLTDQEIVDRAAYKPDMAAGKRLISIKARNRAGKEVNWTVTDWANEYGITKQTIRRRISDQKTNPDKWTNQQIVQDPPRTCDAKTIAPPSQLEIAHQLFCFRGCHG